MWRHVRGQKKPARFAGLRCQSATSWQRLTAGPSFGLSVPTPAKHPLANSAIVNSNVFENCWASVTNENGIDLTCHGGAVH